MPDVETDPVDVVRRGYDALSLRYRADDASPGRYVWAMDRRAARGAESGEPRP
jgi:hypothetical protein